MSAIYPHPVDFRQALETRAVQAILPTGMDSAMLRTLPRAVRERAVFSAGVQNTDFLTRVGEAIDRITSGQTNKATERTILRQLAESLEMPAIAKDSRLDLILDTQTRMADGYGAWVEGQHPSVLDMWPCYELYRAEERKEPRDWPARWEEAGGEFYPDSLANSAVSTIQINNDLIVCLRDETIWSNRISRVLQNAYIRGMELHVDALPIERPGEIQALQRAWHNGVSGMARKFPGLLARHGGETKGDDPRTDRWIKGLFTRELPLGLHVRAESESKGVENNRVERAKENDSSMGEGLGYSSHGNSHEAESSRMDGRAGVHSSSNEKQAPSFSNSDYPEGRMIAIKSDPIWVEISEFGLPYPPFAYNSGMSLRDIDHDEAVQLGIIDDDYLPTPQKLGFNDGLEASIGPLAAQFGLGVALGDILGHLVRIATGGEATFQ